MTTKNVGVFGSCLAGLTAAMLAGLYGWKRLNNTAVVRSDLFVKYFIDQHKLPSREMIEVVLSIKPEHAEVARPMLDNMFPNTAGTLDLPLGTMPLTHNLLHASFDLFLLDNLHDTNLPKHAYASFGGQIDFEINFPFHWCEHSQSQQSLFQLFPRLEAAESAQNWARIIRYLRMKQPAAHIIFICAPSSTILNDEGRRARADAFEAELRAAVCDAGIEIIPQLQIPPELSKLPDDQEHFDMLVYRALAGRALTSVLMTSPATEVRAKPPAGAA